MSDGSPTLADFHLPYVRVECRKCGRRGRYRLAGLMTKHGARYRFLDLRQQFVDDCNHVLPGRKSFETCGVGFPDLLELAKMRKPGNMHP